MIQRERAGPGQESVWDYPRPPRIEPVARRLVVRLADRVLAETSDGFRVLETSHPPVYYFPPCDADFDLLVPAPRGTMCEFKGAASYWNARVGDLVRERVAWSYPDPVPEFGILKDYLAFYAGRVDECLVDGERAKPQEGDFYGGWITSDVVGPFKGGPGTWGW